MKTVFLKIFLIVPLLSLVSFPQDYASGNKVSLNLFSAYESWTIEDNPDFSEFSNILGVNYLPARYTKLTLATRYASVGGSVKSLSGLTDTQLLLSQQLKDYNLIFNAGINLPSGKTKLNSDEFLTSQVISQDLFELRTSNFGQGLNMLLGVTWLHPLSKTFVIGAGVSYQIKNEYQPIDSIGDKYKPSNEVSFTTGFDFKINKTSSLTGDVVGIFYGSDEIDGKEVFASGNRLVSSLIYKKYFGFNFITAILLYRNIAIDELKGVTGFIENEKLNPNQFYLSCSFSQRITTQFDLAYGLFGSFYEKTAAFFSGYNLYGLTLSPQIRLSPTIRIPIILKYGNGSASGKPDLQNFEIGAGINVIL